MPDLTRHVSQGDPLVIGAGAYNQFLDVARWWGHRKRGPEGGAVVPAGFPATLVVQVKNDTEGDLDERAVLTPTGVEISPVDDDPLDVQRQPVFTGGAPAATSDPVLVLIEPVAAGGVGAAAVGGTAVVTVNVSDADHLWARATASNTARLESATSGPARILWREAGSSGDKVAVVALNNGGIPGGAAAGGCGPWQEVVTGITCDAGVMTVQTKWLQVCDVSDTDPT